MRHKMTFGLTFFLYICLCEGLPFSIIDIAGKVYDVFDLTRNVLEAVGYLEQDDTLKNSDLNNLIKDIEERINAAQTDIINNVLFHSRLERVDDAVIVFRSLLIDLDNILHAKTTEEKKRFEKTFVSHFGQHDALIHIRFLPDLLSYQIPGTSAPLVDLYADRTRCNMTALYEFKLYYINLVSSGIALQMTEMYLTDNPLINRTLERWDTRKQSMESTFVKQRKGCIDKFAAYADEDVEKAYNADRLWVNNNQRYTWKISDVIFLKPIGSFRFLYTKNFGDHLFLKRGNSTKVVVFTDKTEVNKSVNVSLTKTKEDLKSAVLGERDDNAAKNVGIEAENLLQKQGYKIRALLVYFNGGEIGEEKVNIDGNSSVIHASVQGVKLTYCSASGIKCTVDVAGLFGAIKDVTGSMEIYAYVTDDEITSEYKTNDANETNAVVTIVYLIISAVGYIRY